MRISDWSSDVCSSDLVQRDLDDNEDAQRRSQREQDGSEVRSVELERLIAQGLTLIERRNAFEFLRDHAAELFEGHTGLAWKPLSASKVNHRALPAPFLDSPFFFTPTPPSPPPLFPPSAPPSFL